jgi:hypothetical protein
MKLFTGSLAAGLVLLAAGVQAQVPYEIGGSPYAAVSDFDSPYAAVPREIPGPRYAPEIPGPRYGYGPSLLPSTEVYTVLRENGFSPLGIPRLRGFVYTIAVIDRGGEDGRLIIDARNGRIIRFVPAHRMGDNFSGEPRVIYGSPGVPPPAHVSGSPRSTPKVASRTVPVPKAKPLAAKPAPAPVQQAAAPPPKPAEVQAAAPQAATTGSVPAKPEPQIAPTQEMPKVQGLE